MNSTKGSEKPPNPVLNNSTGIQPSGRMVIVGVGMVGSACGFALINQRIGSEVLLIDIAEEMLSGQALDINQASSLIEGYPVRAIDYSELKDGDVVVVTSGAAQREGQTRMDLAETNVKILRSVLGEIKASRAQVYVVIVSNPVDVLTEIAVQELDFPRGLVFGSGTLLDSARLRTIVASEVDADVREVEALVIGEHGDSSVSVLSQTRINGKPLADELDLNPEKTTELNEKVRQAAYEIIAGKGVTNYGIGAAVAKICHAICANSNETLPLSVSLAGEYELEGISIGVPSVVGTHGATPAGELDLTESEATKFKKSAKIIREKLDELLG